MNELKDIKDKVIKFRDKRNWKQFHSVKDLLIGLNIECSELMEHFLWKSEKEVDNMLNDKKSRKEIEDEFGDIFIFIMYLADAFKTDPVKCASRKMRINSKKYPVKKSYNSNRKYNKIDV